MNWLLRMLLILVLYGYTGCALHQPVTDEVKLQKIEQLSADLHKLGDTAHQHTAELLAEQAVLISRQLAVQYDVKGSPRLHNLLVNMGVKERGLCFHWTDDLLLKLRALEQDEFDFISAVANRDSDLGEHSSVVVVIKGSPFESGIVLDGWRYSGDLYWAPVSSDRYQWSPRYPGKPFRKAQK